MTFVLSIGQLRNDYHALREEWAMLWTLDGSEGPQELLQQLKQDHLSAAEGSTGQGFLCARDI